MEEPERDQELDESFRQSRKEFWFMLGAWIVFAAWTIVFNGLFAGRGKGEPPEVLFGLPKWIVGGVLVPWVLAAGVSIWFALCYMKDTLLEDGGAEEKE